MEASPEKPPSLEQGYDLLIRGGHVVDPSQGLDGRVDIAIRGGRIIQVAREIPQVPSGRVIDATGWVVTPGLVDCHMHAYWGGTEEGLDVDAVCLPKGVTTVLDGGSAGSFSFHGLQRWIIEGSRSRVLAYVNLSRIGLTAAGLVPELFPEQLVDAEGCLRVLREHPGSAVGVKIRTSWDATGGPAAAVLQIARRVADESGTRVMLHIGNSVETLPEILSYLKPGDVVTHCYTPLEHGILDGNGRLLPQVREATEAGIAFDCAHGRRHFSLDVARRAMDQGLPPTTISSDLATVSLNGPSFDLLTTMNKFLALGMSLAQVVERVTSAPAALLRRMEQFGTLRPGSEADVALLGWEEGDFPLVDSKGETLHAQRRLRAVATVRAGEMV